MAASGVLLMAGATVMLAVERLEIVGESMCPTLEPGDRVLVVRFVPLRVGDLVALADPRQNDRIVVKRVAAIDRGRFTVLGENPRASTDSRHFGPVTRRAIAGRVVYRYAPPWRQGWMANSPDSQSAE
jgi:nickel-type superoxide dismutase maturation protease